MTNEQKRRIGRAWDVKRTTYKQIQATADALAQAAAGKLSQDEMDKRFAAHANAVAADAKAIDEVEAALKDAGVL